MILLNFKQSRFIKFSHILSLIVLVFTFSNCETKKEESNESHTKYYNAALEVQPFAENVRVFTINIAVDEAYYTLLSPLNELSVIIKIQRGDINWGQPKISRFSGQYTDLEPFNSPDNLRLYFECNRPTSKDSTAVKDIVFGTQSEKRKLPNGRNLLN